MPDVLVLTTSYPTPESPVAGIFVREHIRAVAPEWRATVLHLERTPRLKRIVVERDGDDVARIVRVLFPERPTAVSYVALLAAAAVGMRAVRRDGFTPDLLHAHFATAALPAVLLGRLQRTPVVVSEHWTAFLPDDPATLSPLLRFSARYAFSRAALVVCVSGALERSLATHGIKAETRVVPNPVDLDVFHPPVAARAAGPTRLLSVGLFNEQKGFDLLLGAAGLLHATRDDFRLDLVGDGPLRGEYEALARRLGIADLVEFHGLRTKAEVAELMRAADLYVLASRFDNNPVALIEALASGLPAVATAVGGVPELIDDETLLAQPEPASIAAAIGGALDRLDTFDRDAIARQAAERFGSDAVGRVLRAAYAGALAG